jgi:hypothetical protein
MPTIPTAPGGISGKRTPPSARQTLRAAAELDARRQAQIANQIASINRLLSGEHGYTDEMSQLHQELADTQARLEEALTELARLKSTSGL